jgi:hypothetical protein
MWRIKHSALAVALVSIGVSAAAGSAVAVLKSAGDTIQAGATKKTTMVRFDGPPQSTSSLFFHDIPGTQATITFSKPSILLVTLTAESSCVGPTGVADWCTVGIFVDGVGQLGPGLGTDFAFDSTNLGSETQGSWEGHAMQRSSDVLPPGTYTIRPQYAVVGLATTFQIDDVHVTVEAVQA